MSEEILQDDIEIFERNDEIIIWNKKFPELKHVILESTYWGDEEIAHGLLMVDVEEYQKARESLRSAYGIEIMSGGSQIFVDTNIIDDLAFNIPKVKRILETNKDRLLAFIRECDAKLEELYNSQTQYLIKYYEKGFTGEIINRELVISHPKSVVKDRLTLTSNEGQVVDFPLLTKMGMLILEERDKQVSPMDHYLANREAEAASMAEPPKAAEAPKKEPLKKREVSFTRRAMVKKVAKDDTVRLRDEIKAILKKALHRHEGLAFDNEFRELMTICRDEGIKISITAQEYLLGVTNKPEKITDGMKKALMDVVDIAKSGAKERQRHTSEAVELGRVIDKFNATIPERVRS